MPQFTWDFGGELEQSWSTRSITDADELLYRALRSLVRVEIQNPPGNCSLRMFSYLERRWMVLRVFPGRAAWPYLDPVKLFEVIGPLLAVVQQHYAGHSQNPCGEIVIGEPREDQLMRNAAAFLRKRASERRWRELLEYKRELLTCNLPQG